MSSSLAQHPLDLLDALVQLVRLERLGRHVELLVRRAPKEQVELLPSIALIFQVEFVAKHWMFFEHPSIVPIAHAKQRPLDRVESVLKLLHRLSFGHVRRF